MSRVSGGGAISTTCHHVAAGFLSQKTTAEHLSLLEMPIPISPALLTSRTGSRCSIDNLSVLRLAGSTQLPNEYAGHREPNPIVRSSHSLNSTSHVAALRRLGSRPPDTGRHFLPLMAGPAGLFELKRLS